MSPPYWPLQTSAGEETLRYAGCNGQVRIRGLCVWMVTGMERGTEKYNNENGIGVHTEGRKAFLETLVGTKDGKTSPLPLWHKQGPTEKFRLVTVWNKMANPNKPHLAGAQDES